jgi:hypothetical protein
MKVEFENYQDSLFVITLLFFLVGMIHISLAMVGALCFIIPFVQYKKYKQQVWCKYYCPRAGLFSMLLSKISLKRKMPKWMTGQKIKKIVLVYFTINVFFATMSTLMVSLGRMPEMDYVRFLIVFRAPFTLPQMLDFYVPTGMIHLGYRLYSIMFTSTTIGLILGFLYVPKAWCVICPVRTLTSK